MPSSENVHNRSGWRGMPADRVVKPIIEWLIWVGLAAIAYSQTGYFDTPIQNYAFGATGWPRALCLLIAIGATLQLIHHFVASPGADDPEADKPVERTARTWQRIGILVLPFLYLLITPWIGFYVSTPIFIATLLLLLEVRSIKAILGVTALIYLIVLVIFTRFFFVALPTGRIDAMYEVNLTIIDIARMGL